MAHLLRAVVARVTEQQGEPPELIVISHPANYGPYKKDLLGEAVRQADVGPVSYVTEPEAAAVHYSRLERLAPGDVVAVYDFGGGTFDAAILRKTETGFDLLGTPEGMERLGGIDFDHAVFAHVDAALGGKIAELDASDSTAMSAAARLREECRDAKEALSADTDATIAVLLPNVQTEIRLTRGEFEDAIRPRIAETIATLERAIRNAGLALEDISRVLLVGGSSRIPLVGQMVREATGRPVAVDAHPKFAIALGAAIVGMTDLGIAPAAVVDEPTAAASVFAAEAVPAAAPVATPVPAPLFVEAPKSKRKGLVSTLLLGIAILVVGGLVVTQVGNKSDTISLTNSESSRTTLVPADGAADESASAEQPAGDASAEAPATTAANGKAATPTTARGASPAAGGSAGSGSGSGAAAPATPATTAPGASGGGGSGGGPATTAAPGAAPTTIPAPAVRPIVFVCGTKICRINPDGSGSKEIAPEGGEPALSPDGSKVAYVVHEGRNQIYIKNADGTGAATKVTNETNWTGQIDWSSDGTQIAYYMYGEIFVIGADGGGRRRVLPKEVGRTDFFPDWSPDGTKIAFHSTRAYGADGPSTDIWVVAAAGGAPTRLTTSGDAANAAWHPDGSKILYAAGGALATVPAGGGTPTSINTGGGSGTKSFAQWSADGSKIVYMLNGADLWVHTVGGGSAFLTAGANPDWR
jgi:actin-like ATPase involved in cell morphogenesis